MAQADRRAARLCADGLIEALACGTPVAAFPVAWPLDVLDARSGAMAERLDDAIAAALRLDREACVARARQFSWRASADQFLAALVPGSRDDSLPKAA